MNEMIAPRARLVASRSRDLAISAIKEMSIRSAQIPDAASLAWGLPSFRTPAPIRAAVAEALESDFSLGMYTLPGGLPEVCETVAAAHEYRTGVRVDAGKNVTITAGNMEGLNALFGVLVDPGDEVIVTDPGFVSHISQIRFNGGVPVFWKMHEGRGWEPDIAELPALIGPRTKAIVLVTPSNPTSSILSEATLRAVAKLARAHGVLVILDDPYSQFTYENRAQYFNLASLPEYADTIVYLFTFSKCYAMSGWRVGYMVMPAALRAEIVKVHDLTMICTPRISPLAAKAALEGDQSHLADFERTLDRRRHLICERLDRLGHVFQYIRPQGAYYVFPRVMITHDDDVAFAHRLLDEAQVTVTPGSAFGPAGKHHVRMAFCVEDDVINQAFDRMEAYFGT
ncbi:pyridoxal phosphate-dependent aminotransferase [uncultured Tateyamaria sp.]|uniref:pyridoxal phosphate-dependent aminotransferase n=1 Tax=uncultured Tateyamaria sp. TaxID=455651 RepID=UPI0026219B66|nr:pyridoxal phosphate-dependent aminotransferase [uncultured Tateyamaria sp.]